MSKIWGSISFLIIFVLGVIIFIVIDVFSSQPEKLSNNFITFTINSQTLYSGTNQNQEPYVYNLEIETSYDEGFENQQLSCTPNVRVSPQSIGAKVSVYNFYVINGTSIEFTFSSNNYETKTQTYNTIYKVNGETQIFAESVKNLPNSIEIDLKNTSTYEILYSILPSNANCYELEFLKSDSNNFSISNNIITALSVGNGSIFVWLDDTLVKTIPVNIIQTEEQEEENGYGFDISLINNYYGITFDNETKTATLSASNFGGTSITVAFEIFITEENSPTVFVWNYQLSDEENIVLGTPYSPTFSYETIALTFGSIGQVLLNLFNTEFGISETITINIVP